MAIEPAGSTPVRDPDANLFLRVQEEFFGVGIWSGANTAPQQQNTGPALAGVGTRYSMLQNTGGGTLAGGILVDGRRIMQGSSDVGSVRFRRGGECMFPLSQTFQTANALIGILTNRRNRRYLFSVAVRITAQAAGGRLFVNLSEADGGLNGTRPGVGFFMDTTINGGRVTPVIRRTNAGALVQGPDTGITLLNQWHLLGIRYTELATPRIEWLVDNVPVFLTEGDANMLTYPGGGSLEPGWMPEYGWSQHAGSVAQFGPALYEVVYIG